MTKSQSRREVEEIGVTWLKEISSKYCALREVVLEPGAAVPLQLKHGGFSALRLNEPPPQLRLAVKVSQYALTLQSRCRRFAISVSFNA